ncbi:MAG: FAD-dependent oxidoreductase [Desulfobacteraceae bacterium]|nr:FAD-dependent oxidoreductase [Desulfobacteraceae bacterium]
MNFLIIGGDAAGMSAASRAKRNLPELNVTVLEKSHDVSYSACGMPYNIADAERNMDDLVARPASVFREKQGINLLTGHLAESISPLDQTVSGVSGQGQPFSFPYDRLLIATGGAPIVPDIPGKSLPGVMALKSLDHGRKLKAYIANQNVKRVVIVGMGFIALEMCEALRTRAIQVDIIKPGPVFLPWMDAALADIVQKEVVSHGVELHFGHDVEQVDSCAGRLSVSSPSLSLDADMVLFAIGIKPNSEIAAKAGAALGPQQAIAVDKLLQTSIPNIYAAGDCADAFHVVTGQKTWIPLALRANRGGWAVADTITGKPAELPGVCGTAVVKVFDCEIARTGLNEKESKHAGFLPVSETIKARSRAHSHPGASDIWVHMVADQKSGRLLGVQMVGREGVAHRINAVAVALHNKMTIEQFVQSDLAYAPPFGPVWDPLLTAANQMLKKI